MPEIFTLYFNIFYILPTFAILLNLYKKILKVLNALNNTIDIEN